jgi:hypothetical protein
MTPAQRSKVTYDIDGAQWWVLSKSFRLSRESAHHIRNKWSNPEFIIYDNGVRLEHLSDGQQSLILQLLKESMSEIGYEKVIGAIKTNVFLGQICHAQAILNAGSYL